MHRDGLHHGDRLRHLEASHAWHHHRGLKHFKIRIKNWGAWWSSGLTRYVETTPRVESLHPRLGIFLSFAWVARRKSREEKLQAGLCESVRGSTSKWRERRKKVGAARLEFERGMSYEKGWARWWFASKAINIKWFDALIKLKSDMERKINWCVVYLSFLYHKSIWNLNNE